MRGLAWLMLVAVLVAPRLGSATPAANGPQRPRDWLDVRRGGVAAVLEAVTSVEGMQPRVLRYRVEGDGAAAGYALELRRRAAVARKVGGEVVVQVRDKTGRVVAAAASDGAALLVRLGAARPVVDDAALFAPCPGLGVPLALFVALELAPRYDAQLEGEFDGTAIVRLQPSYTRGAGMQPLKIGASKQFLSLTVTEVDDAKGEMVGRLLWLDTALVDGRVVAKRLRLRAQGGEAAIDLVLAEEKVGKAAKVGFGAKALRER